MVYFDLDGVIRNLDAAVRKDQPPAMYYSERVNGMEFCDYIDQNLEVLVEAEPTDYFRDAIQFLERIHIITCQPERWRKYTSWWISRWFGSRATSIYVDRPEQKMEVMKRYDVIVEDSPNFPLPFYDRVILIDRAYNRHIPAPFRCYKPQHLWTALKEFGA